MSDEPSESQTTQPPAPDRDAFEAEQRAREADEGPDAGPPIEERESAAQAAAAAERTADDPVEREGIAADASEWESDPGYLTELTDWQGLQPGQVIRRRSDAQGKDQQGCFRRISDEGDGLICTDVVNMRDHEYAAEAGVIRPAEGDRLYVHKTRFGDDAVSQEALEVVRNWTLFREHPQIRQDILDFVTHSFSPGQIREWKRKDALRWLFVPIQHKFKIGRHKEKINWDHVRVDEFGKALRALQSGKHMTYVAFIPRDTNHDPMFYTYGTKPHLETMKELDRQPYGFRPNHGGHIKCVEEIDGVKRLLVDAGSNDLGGGMHTPLSTAEMIVEGLKKLYPKDEFRLEYTPVPGREAFGLQQSY